MNKPQISNEEAKQILAANKVSDKIAIIGIRGYYLDSIGKRGENERNVYDDAILIISARKFETFRANTDPSVYRKHIATMKTGVHRYYKGKHKNRYWALRLVGEQVPVTRDGEPDGIGVALNIHKGGNRTTGSEGCQTLQPADWDDFIEIVYDEMEFYGQKTVPYVLIDEHDRRDGAFKMPTVAAKEFSLDDREIDNLLIRFDKDELVAANQSVGKTQKPVLLPAQNPPTPETARQPQSSSLSPLQPIQNILNETAESLAVPSFGNYIENAQEKISQAQETIGTVINTTDQIKDVIDLINSGKDGKKSLWTYITQVFFQVIWAVAAFVVGLPREIWIGIAVIVGAFALVYLYRQISLGKIRETARLKVAGFAGNLK